MKVSVRATCLAVALATVGAFPAVAGAETFYAQGGGGNGKAPCTQAEPCNLGKAAKKADEVPKGGHNLVVLVSGPDFTPEGSVLIRPGVEMGPEEGQPRPTIRGASDEAVLENEGYVHDVNVVAGGEGVAVASYLGAVSRVYAESTGFETPACVLEFFGEIEDSVCVGRVGAGILAYVLGAEVANVDAIGATNGLELIGSETAGNSVELAGSNVIAVGGPGYADVKADTYAGGGATEIEMRTSDYDSIDRGAEPSLGVITAPGTEGNITAPPRFADAVAGDFHQLPTSPTVDAGVAPELPEGSTFVEYDLDHGPRGVSGHAVCGGPPIPSPGPYDIGAFELIPAAPDCSTPPAPKTTAPPPPLPAAPGTTLKKAKIDTSGGTATFTFGATGASTGFACELVAPVPKSKGGKSPKRKKSKFAACGSPKSYKHLKPGRYTFKVQATGPGGADATPASKGFTIGGGTK